MRSAIVHGPIDVHALLAEVAASSNGATVLFTGTVRELSEGRSVEGIDYDAYEEMAREELARIVREASERFGTGHVVAEHRVGSLALGEASVAIAVGHPRRAGAFDAARYVIEEIKLRLPVWKQELFTDGTREWVDARVAP
ncbi:MAG: molybdenum cofactor biosynthesis protein MoaE [Gemmatimonadaceae bacterium]|nr:molybdenum cofactor biosynthesis protein MoaE [Gemmatimonadaceae bacterium]NUQ93413.1 molybdenum cofactor biosynthesis protein MoaE [Gemmatimonadaceae bacterium]NUR20183.1 molybdenum cofactor biosynthesis protein MoaE [Gemmatimonadaceae bacterium]NUS97644.1 molybdenum cofactor biosynthesis protein MoaE [Gemmatimonadaceae bacterium]